MTYTSTYKGKEKTYTFPRAPETCNWAVWFSDPRRLATRRSGLVLWVGSAHSEMAGHLRTRSTHHYHTRKQYTLGSGRQVGISRPHTAYTWGRCKNTTSDRGFPSGDLGFPLGAGAPDPRRVTTRLWWHSLTMRECIHKVDCPSTREEKTLLDLVGPHWRTLFTPCCQAHSSHALHSPTHTFRGVPAD